MAQRGLEATVAILECLRHDIGGAKRRASPSSRLHLDVCIELATRGRPRLRKLCEIIYFR